MSKRLIQSKLSFFSSRPKHANDKVSSAHLKRKLSDRVAEKDLGVSEKKTKMSSYADITRKNGSTSDRDNNSSTKNKGTHTHKMNNKRPAKDEAEGSTSAGRSFQSSEHRNKPFASSQSKFDSHENTGASSNFRRFNSQTSDTEFYQNHKPPKDYNEDADHGHVQKKIEKEKPQTLLEVIHTWRGVFLDELKRAPECFKQKDISLPPLRANSSHKVFFDIRPEGWDNEIPTPYKDGRQDIWDENHVHMPYSSNNSFTENDNICYRWERIVKALTTKITGSFELERAILSYNPHYKSRWNFDSLHQYFEESEAGKNMKDDFFLKILPTIQQLALRLPELCPLAIPILKQRKDMKVTLSQQQVACLLANAFFCTFPRRNFKVKNGQLPDINFSNFFSDSHSSRKFEKFRCIINYFERVTENMPTGTVTYARQWVPAEAYFWNKSDKKFTNLHVSTSGTIEDDGKGMLQADFANKYVGGGVLGHGLVQEEIRFLICPEMILSRLFTEVLTDCEVLIMTGCERFSNYEGYSETFKFSGNHEDKTERDEWGRRFTEVVAMDALIIRGGYKSQFEHEKLFRELNKAHCAFKGNQFKSNLPAVCTGNWGCGAFGGDKQLKALIQMMAASAVDRDVCYFTFGDSTFCNQLGQFYSILKENDLKICHVLDMIKHYKDFLNSNTGPDKSLFEFIANMLGSNVDSPVASQEIDYPILNGDSPMDSEKWNSDEDFKASTP